MYIDFDWIVLIMILWIYFYKKEGDIIEFCEENNNYNYRFESSSFVL